MFIKTQPHILATLTKAIQAFALEEVASLSYAQELLKSLEERKRPLHPLQSRLLRLMDRKQKSRRLGMQKK